MKSDSRTVARDRVVAAACVYLILEENTKTGSQERERDVGAVDLELRGC